MRNLDRVLGWLGALFLLVWFFTLAGGGLRAWFSGDDLMNLYAAWSTPWSGLVCSNLMFWGGEFRPFGAVWYRTVFAFSGFDPLPFHAAAFAILLVNIVLAWLLARRLTGSPGTAFLAALIVSYNARFANLYYDTGAIYDVLCFFLYYAALLWYVRLRQPGVYPGVRELGALAALTVCALNSKEMAATLPAALLLYEALWHPPRRGAWKKWALDEGRGAVVTGILVLVFVVGKAFAHQSLMYAPEYRMTFTAERALGNASLYVDHIFYQYGWFTPAGALGLWAAMGVSTALLRSRAMAYGWLLSAVTIAPMLFPNPRGGSAIYVCLFAWALYGAALLDRLTAPLARLAAPRVRYAALTAAALYPLHRFEGGFTSRSAMESGELMRRTWTSLLRAQPHLRPGARVLFLDDPVRAGVHDMAFLVKLGYGDDSLLVERAKTMPGRPDWSRSDYVFDRVSGTFVAAKRP